MTHTSMSNFLNNTEIFLSNIVENQENITVESNQGNIIIISEHEYEKINNCINDNE